MHRDLHAVTFDCWGTLIYEPKREQGALTRREIFRKCLKSHGVEVTDERAHDVLREVWMRHWREWQAGISTDSTDMAGWGLEAFGISDRAAVERLGCDLAEASLEQEVLALDGARETLEQLARRKIRRALICDTGYSPGRVVRQLLQREGLLELLEVLIFSNEAGVPKPNSRIFQAALDPLRVGPDPRPRITTAPPIPRNTEPWMRSTKRRAIDCSSQSLGSSASTRSPIFANTIERSSIVAMRRRKWQGGSRGQA